MYEALTSTIRRRLESFRKAVIELESGQVICIGSLLDESIKCKKLATEAIRRWCVCFYSPRCLAR